MSQSFSGDDLTGEGGQYNGEIVARKPSPRTGIISCMSARGHSYLVDLILPDTKSNSDRLLSTVAPCFHSIAAGIEFKLV